jgi:heat-inducible transcriptional repressor
VHNKTVSLPDGISSGDAERLFNILNERLHGTPMYRIRSRIQEEIAQQMARHLEDYEESMRLLDQILVSLSAEADAKVYLGGATHMLEQPEFRDVQKVLPVLNWLESTERVAKTLRSEENSGELRVRIGGENGVLTLQDCSLVTATYQVGGAPLGVIAVVGPTRMDYARVIRLMELLSRGMTDAVERYFTG